MFPPPLRRGQTGRLGWVHKKGPLPRKTVTLSLKMKHKPTPPPGNSQETAVRARIFRKLAADSTPQVRLWVAGNRATPEEVLERLAADPDSNVRSYVIHGLGAKAGSRPIFPECPDSLP